MTRTSDKIVELELLFARRRSAQETLAKLEKVKEFTSITIKGEDGAENTGSISFDWQQGSKVRGMVRAMIVAEYENELKDVEALIEEKIYVKKQTSN